MTSGATSALSICSGLPGIGNGGLPFECVPGAQVPLYTDMQLQNLRWTKSHFLDNPNPMNNRTSTQPAMTRFSSHPGGNSQPIGVFGEFIPANQSESAVWPNPVVPIIEVRSSWPPLRAG